MSMRMKSRLFDVMVYGIVVIVSILMIYPFLYIIAVSLSAPGEIHGSNITFYPKGATLDAYRYIFRLPSVYFGYLNSVLYTAVGTLLSICFTVLCAYPLSKPWLYGRGPIIMIIVVTMFVSGGLIPVFILVKMLGLYDTMWALILPGVLSTFLMFIALAFFKGIPLDLEEASYMDGADDLDILTKVYLPLSKPIIATLSLFYAVGYWNAWFPAAIFLNDAAKYPVQLILRNMMMGTGIGTRELAATFGELQKTGQINIKSLNYALIVAVIAPIVLLYPFVQKHFIKGAMIGSLKG